MEKSLLIGGILLATAATVLFMSAREVDGPSGPPRAHVATEVELPASPPIQAASPLHRDRLPRTNGPLREPSYDAGPPAYCQVAFGKSGEARHWLVLSGTVLYVDLDGDGDLTGEGERFEGVQGAEDLAHETAALRVGSETYTLTHVRYEIGSSWLTVVDPEGRRWGAWGDERGRLRFAARARDAPVIHFDGPLEMGVETWNTIWPEGEGKVRISVGVGCRGQGPGSFAHLDERWVPKGAVPEATAEFPSPSQGGAPIVVETRLEQRC